MVALNSYDAAGMKSVMRFPHVRLAENRVAIYQADPREGGFTAETLIGLLLQISCRPCEN